MLGTIAPSQQDDLGLSSGAGADEAASVKFDGADPDEVMTDVNEAKAESSTTAVLASRKDGELTDEEKQAAEEAQSGLIDEYESKNEVDPDALDLQDIEAVDNAESNDLISAQRADELRAEMRDEGDESVDVTTLPGVESGPGRKELVAVIGLLLAAWVVVR